jgi:hypothetical protein
MGAQATSASLDRTRLHDVGVQAWRTRTVPPSALPVLAEPVSVTRKLVADFRVRDTPIVVRLSREAMRDTLAEATRALCCDATLQESVARATLRWVHCGTRAASTVHARAVATALHLMGGGAGILWSDPVQCPAL